MNNRRSPASKPKDFKKAIINLFGYCKDYYRLIIFAIVLSIISSIFSIIGPGKVRDIINEITIGLTSTINMEVIKDITLFLAVMYVLGAIFHYVEAYLMAIMTNKLSKNLRNKISVKINKIPLKYFDSTSYGDILSRVTNDVDTISRTLSESVSDLVSSIVLFIGVVLVMFITNPVMAIYTTTSELDVKYTGEVLEDITGKILISGDLEYGATLIVDTSEIKPTDCNLTYKWYSNSIASTENGTQIKTGTNTYQITKAEIGKYIYVEVVATKDGYNERTIKAITYDTVGKMIIQKPKVSGEYIYTGTEQTVQLENYNTATMTASNITRINSGKQVVTVSLKDSSIYSWEDQTTADVKLEWEIKKLDRTLTIEKSVELEQGKTTILTYKYDGENADVYVKNDNETVISVTNTSTTNGGTLTIVGKEIGKAGAN